MEGDACMCAEIGVDFDGKCGDEAVADGGYVCNDRPNNYSPRCHACVIFDTLGCTEHKADNKEQTLKD